MQVIKKIIPAIAMAIAILAMPSSSAAISSATGPEPWGEFLFGEVDSFADACTVFTCTASSAGNSFFLDTPAWTFTGSGFLIVQDAFTIGDQFSVFDNGLPIGDTSTPIGSVDCGSNPVDCFANPNSSRRIFSLLAGDHSFTIQTLVSPLLGGASYLCIDSGQGECGVPLNGDHEVPEPTSILLLALGFAGAFLWVERPQLSKIAVLVSRKPRQR